MVSDGRTAGPIGGGSKCCPDELFEEIRLETAEKGWRKRWLRRTESQRFVSNMLVKRGIAVSPGVAIGPAVLFGAEIFKVQRHYTSKAEIDAEIPRLTNM